MAKEVSVSLDEVMSKRQFSIGKTKAGDEALFKVFKRPATWDEKSRSAVFVMTAEIADRYGDIVMTMGADMKDFNKNPVVLWAHNSRAFPIGLWSDIKQIQNATPKRMEGRATFHEEGTTDDADTAAKLIAQGALRACSIGFMPKKWESIKDDQDRWTGYRFKEWELMECSVCSVPANPAAIVKAAGGDTHLALQAIELVLEEWARTPDGLIVPREDYEKAYAIERNQEVTVHEVRAIEEEPVKKTGEIVVKLDTSDVIPAIKRELDAHETGFIARLKEMFGLVEKTPAAPEVIPADPATASVEAGDPPLEVDEKDAEAFKEAAAELDVADEEEEMRARAMAARLKASLAA